MEPRPSSGTTSEPGALTVEGVVGMESFRRGAPRLLNERATAAARAEVRWVHVIETTDATGLLEGGEVVLSTARLLDAAIAEGRGDEAAGRFLDGIERAGAVALAAEVLTGRDAVVRVLRAAAAHRELPVYVLERQVRFVAVTQEAHRRIAARQLEQLETDRRVHETFTQLTLEAAPVQRIVAEAGRLLGSEVVWHPEDGFGAARPGADIPLTAWSSARAEAPGTWESPDGRPGSGTPGAPEVFEAAGLPSVPVVVAGETVGTLRLEPGRDAGRPQHAGTLPATVLERAAQAVALTLLAERSRQDQRRQAETALLHELRRPWNLSEGEAVRRAQGLGVGSQGAESRGHHAATSTSGPVPAPAAWLPVVLRWDGARAASSSGVWDQQRGGRLVLEALARGLARARATALAGRLGAESVAVLLPLESRAVQEALLERVLAGMRRSLGESVRLVAGVADAEGSLLRAAARLDEAGFVAEAAVSLVAAEHDAARPGSAPRRTVFRAQDVRLRGLLSMVGADERLLAFARAELELVLDPERAAELELLERFIECGGNKSLLAQRIHLSRPALYARLERLQRRLGVSLDDPESRTSLHVALLVHRMTRR